MLTLSGRHTLVARAILLSQRSLYAMSPRVVLCYAVFPVVAIAVVAIIVIAVVAIVAVVAIRLVAY